LPNKCRGSYSVSRGHHSIFFRFINCEKWRKDFKVDDLVRNFEYKEKPQVFEYYPQYYHKTDKVSFTVVSLTYM